ncbi:ABC transporter ATP-binding protein [Moritella sp. JT01]|uniref:ABC transporter ATP-binding protein n=1 Tax=Moritella sp. JT01 TaxID=756698 RepID=UPI000831CB59|nr:ABC transporter ATP-binding protein [Moritella sp. JT01]
MSVIIDVDRIVKKYGQNEKKVVDELSFQVKKGQCFGLLGPNGAGKSTTLEMMQGLRKVSSGRITLFGMDWKKDEKKLRGRIGGLLQTNHLYERLTVKEAINLFGSFYHNASCTDEVIERFNLIEQKNTWLSLLSGGQRQRVFLAMTIVGRPELIFLDEPTTGLDPSSRQEFWDIIKSLKNSGTTVILTTHYMDEADYLCDELAIIDHGKIIESGSPDEIIKRTFTDPVLNEPRRATLNDVFLKLTGFGINTQEDKNVV